MIDTKDLFSTYWYHSYRPPKRKNKALPSTKMKIILTNSCCYDITNCNVIVSAIILRHYKISFRKIVSGITCD